MCQVCNIFSATPVRELVVLKFVYDFAEAALDNVSCSPFRVPACLEAGRAAAASGGSDTR
jgi:hypothetical protein